MKSCAAVTVLVGFMASAWLQQASAQAPNRGHALPQSRPAVSPYLDLTRGPDTSFTYHRRVLPDLELRAATTQNRQAIGKLRSEQEKAEETKSKLSGTGHATQFMNLSHFYPSRNR
ncbi:MAG: hypothetical protein HY000_16655 [Planctomycetes bacterium]|nr:hypothetical protein [Planctomycetota bacterium]